MVYDRRYINRIYNWDCGVIGSRVSLRNLWRNPCRFDADQSHQLFY